MISFDSENRIFKIHNNSVMLCLYLNSFNVLETIYFGEYKNDVSLSNKSDYSDNWSTSYFDKKENREISYPDKSSNRLSRFEIGSHGISDNRPALVIIQKSNGNYETNLVYVSHRVYNGYPAYQGLPHAHSGNIETIEFTLKDEFNESIIVKYNISIDLEKDIIVKNLEVNNNGLDDVKLLRAMSYQLDLDNDQYDLHHFAGRWGRERREKINPIIDGEQVIASNYGRSSHEENPFIFLTNKKSDEVIGFNFIYSGNFKFSIFNDFANSPRITYGLNDFNFAWILRHGETFITPQAVLSYSKNGIDQMSNNFHRFVKENIITYKLDKEYKPVLFNSWEGCEMTFNTESVLSYIDDSSKIGTELFVLDDGWFGQRNDDFSSLGDWYVNENKIDLHKVKNYLKEKNIKFGIWFEPEMISYDSDLYKKHPDYAIGHEREHISLHRHQLMLDFTNKEVVDNIFNQMCKVIDEYQFDYIKWDHNRDLKECYVSSLGPDRQGEVTHRIVLGYYDLIERLIKRYPNVMFEGCASGGGRFDLGSLYYCPQIWCSDNTDPTMRMFIQYNTSLGYPLQTMGSHVSKSDTASYLTKAYLALFGTYGHEMNPNNLDQTTIYELNSVSELYKKYHKDVFEDGVLYHLSSPESSNIMSMEVINQNKTTAFVLLMSKESQNNKNFILRLKGLKEDTIYCVNDKLKIYGIELMNKGIDISEFKKEFINCDSLFLMIKEQ